MKQTYVEMQYYYSQISFSDHLLSYSQISFSDWPPLLSYSQISFSDHLY
jgi:hypothetical protein